MALLLPDERILQNLGGTDADLTEADQSNVRYMRGGSGERKGGIYEVPDKKNFQGLLNHVLLVRRCALAIASVLKVGIGNKDVEGRIGRARGENFIGDVGSLYYGDVSNGAMWHDAGKRPASEDEVRGIVTGDTHNTEGRLMGERLKLPQRICDIPETHHFSRIQDFDSSIGAYGPLNYSIAMADVWTSQKFISAGNRIGDIRQRWVTDRIAAGKPPMVTPDVLDNYERVMLHAEKEFMGWLGLHSIDEFFKVIPTDEAEETIRTYVAENQELALYTKARVENMRDGFRSVMQGTLLKNQE